MRILLYDPHLNVPDLKEKAFKHILRTFFGLVFLCSHEEIFFGYLMNFFLGGREDHLLDFRFQVSICVHGFNFILK